MKRARVSNDFFLDEFIHPALYARFGERSIMWLRPEVIAIAQAVRNIFGKTIINNWSAKGDYPPEVFLKLKESTRKGYFTESGLRSPDTATGAKFSMHKYGCAVDLKFVDATPDEVRKYIAGHYKDKFQHLGLTRFEGMTPSWVHLDIANTGSRELIVFNP